MGTDTRTINLTRYLEVISQMPGVKPEDVSEAQNTLKKLFKDSYETATFSRGLIAGDGKITIPMIHAGPSDNDVSTNYVLSEYGAITNEETGYSSGLSNNLSTYFFAGIFSIDEMTGDYAASAFDKESAVSPAKLIKGLQDYYSCLKSAKTEKCDRASGAQLLASEKTATEERRVAKERAEIEARRSKEAKARETEKAAKEGQINSSNAQSETIWTTVESYYDRAKNDDGVFNSIRPRDLMEIMDRYRSYRFYTGTTDPLENAKIKLQKAMEMIRAVANNSTGWRYFEETCRRGSFLRVRSCGGDTEGKEKVYENQCAYGINKETYDSSGCTLKEIKCAAINKKNC